MNVNSKNQREPSAQEKRGAAFRGMGQMRMLDMHAHLASLSVDYAEKWQAQAAMAGTQTEKRSDRKHEREQNRKQAVVQLGEYELELRKQHGIVTCFSSGTPEEWEYLRQFGARKEILRSFGIHPWYADRYAPCDAREAFQSCDFVGEIGMDTVWCDVPLEIQRRNLEQQLLIAADLGKPVLLHTKGQEAEIARMLAGFPNPVCVHWYSGNLTDLETYLELDCYFTLGPDTASICRSEGEKGSEKRLVCEQMLSEIPLNRLFVETDGISAVAWAKNVELLPLEEIPAVLQENMTFLAEQKACAAETLQRILFENGNCFLGGAQA